MRGDELAEQPFPMKNYYHVLEDILRNENPIEKAGK